MEVPVNTNHVVCIALSGVPYLAMWATSSPTGWMITCCAIMGPVMKTMTVDKGNCPGVHSYFYHRPTEPTRNGKSPMSKGRHYVTRYFRVDRRVCVGCLTPIQFRGTAPRNFGKALYQLSVSSVRPASDNGQHMVLVSRHHDLCDAYPHHVVLNPRTDEVMEQREHVSEWNEEILQATNIPASTNSTDANGTSPNLNLKWHPIPVEVDMHVSLITIGIFTILFSLLGLLATYLTTPFSIILVGKHLTTPCRYAPPSW
ncbi:hypothetical protein EGW08_011398 [Elysia chlorotica]|uniref:Uncharacterized protein n=1 Tax=Elysia chlorotica TaxID=188477 RepID=A0A3S0ZK89_ELYCH|nr:hypothetical protein EGW08_011398 [Elysia chlorotica]